MKQLCDMCDGMLPVVPGLNSNDVLSASSAVVSHVCSDPDSTFHQSITFLTGCQFAVTRAARVWNSDDLWTEILNASDPNAPCIECENCGDLVHEVVMYRGNWICPECEVNCINADDVAGDT